MLSSIILELGREGADLAVRMEAFQILINSCKYVFSPILHCLRILQRAMLVHCGFTDGLQQLVTPIMDSWNSPHSLLILSASSNPA